MHANDDSNRSDERLIVNTILYAILAAWNAGASRQWIQQSPLRLFNPFDFGSKNCWKYFQIVILWRRKTNNYNHNNAELERKFYLSYRDKIILISTQDDATHYWHPAKAALIKLGVTEPILKPFRGSFAFVGYAGVNKPSWIAQEQRARGQGPSVIHLRIPLQQSPPGK